MKFLSNLQIVDLVNRQPSRKLFFRYGDDLIFKKEAKLRNREVSLMELLLKGDFFMMKVEEAESNENQLVFHGYTASDF